MVNLNQTGEAAGVVAAMSTSLAKPVGEVPAQGVREQLTKLGAVIV
jgi:hypothetical protein